MLHGRQTAVHPALGQALGQRYRDSVGDTNVNGWSSHSMTPRQLFACHILAECLLRAQKSNRIASDRNKHFDGRPLASTVAQKLAAASIGRFIRDIRTLEQFNDTACQPSGTSARVRKTNVTTNTSLTSGSSDKTVDESALGAFDMGIDTTRHNNWRTMYQMAHRRLSHVIVNESEIAVSVQSHGQGRFAYATLMGATNKPVREPSKRSDQRTKAPSIWIHGYSQMGAHAWKTGGCLRAPPVILAGEWESREIYVQLPWREPPPVVADECEKAVTVHDCMVKKNSHPQENGLRRDIPLAYQPQRKSVLWLGFVSSNSKACHARVSVGRRSKGSYVGANRGIRTTDLQALPGEYKPAVAIAQFVHNTGMLARFLSVGPRAMDTYEGQASNEQDTDLRQRTDVQAGDVSTKSAHLSIITSNDTDTSLGSMKSSEAVDGDVPQDEDGDVVNAYRYMYRIRFVLGMLLRFAEDGSRLQKVALFSDSQSALRAIQNPEIVSDKPTFGIVSRRIGNG
ncbi:reverse transcriptase [Talaromyces pinophilus]|uniref:Reverse transcriptase n=1 Tax=Talaromyces pinophilus TaxID=128442 RepID=A0A478ECN2_TALPI|nr:reverse transcriptase [Talaromyces pinophilus]